MNWKKKWLKTIERIRSRNVTSQYKVIVTQIGPDFLHVDKTSDFLLIWCATENPSAPAGKWPNRLKNGTEQLTMH